LNQLKWDWADSPQDIRTYGVVALNEECGFIQWVPNTIPVRPVLLKYYEARNVPHWVGLSDLRGAIILTGNSPKSWVTS
jgi:hypothetical protein